MDSFVEGYKVFNSDWSLDGIEYEIGKSYNFNKEITPTKDGFYFYTDMFDYFFHLKYFNKNKKVAKIIATDIIERENHRTGVMLSKKIKLIEELSWDDVFNLINVGRNCIGYNNIGNENYGYNNTGWNNIGNYNVGSDNLGNGNTGCRNMGWDNTGHNNCGLENTGCRNMGWNNTGNSNDGDKNTGTGNLGDYNSGDWNLGNGHNGVFCTGEPKIKIFDVETNMTLSDWRDTDAYKIIDSNFKIVEWIKSEDMDYKDKMRNPSYERTDGYLRTYSYQEAWKVMWSKLTNKEKDIIKNIPNFNEDKFKKITGISI